MNLIDLDDKVVAAVIAAGGTVIGALVQLKLAWRNEVSARARGAPVTKKSRRGPVWAVILLLVAAAVGGFAAAQYWIQRADGGTAELRGALQSQLAQINATAERLERATRSEHDAGPQAVAARRAADTVVASATVGPCRASGATDTPGTCTEAEAVAVTLCASIPAAARVVAVNLFARPEGSAQGWGESRAAPGQVVGRARFADKTFERPEAEQAREVCVTFASWDAEAAYSARLEVDYVLPAPVGAVADAAAAPLADVHP